MQNQKLYHYLIKPELELALARNTLHASEYFLSNGAEQFLWLTFSPYWERIVDGLDQNNDPAFFGLSFQALAETETLIRIQINPSIALRNWDNCLTYFNLSAKDKPIINKHFYSLGTNPNLWRFSFEPIPAIHWWGIECWDGSNWVPYPDWNPDNSMIYLTDHQEVIQNMSTKLTQVESEREKVKAENKEQKIVISSQDMFINSLKSENNKSKQETEEARKQYQHFLESRTASALEKRIKEVEEEKESESFDKEILEEDLVKANEIIIGKDKAIDYQNCHIEYLQKLLWTKGIPFTPHYGHEKNKEAA